MQHIACGVSGYCAGVRDLVFGQLSRRDSLRATFLSDFGTSAKHWHIVEFGTSERFIGIKLLHSNAFHDIFVEFLAVPQEFGC
eukprot:m.329582 g.329582  ORF g.329582 m.329582 type:complete len:83 (+) comp27711_c0_seq5:157-405(+)